jgi:hypothetical protein
MLQADKADLKNQLRLRRLQIEEKELHFYAQSCSEVGTQAALLAGFAFGAMTEVDIDSDSSDAIQATWLFSICMAMLLEIGALVKAMQLSIHGPGLALRGPEGSVAHAIHVMREEYAYSKKLFYAGLFFFHVAVVVLTWSKFTSWAAGSISALVLAGLAWLVKETRSTAHRLKVPKHDGHAAWDPAAGQQQTWSADSDSGSLVVGREGARARAKRGSMFAELNRVKLRPRDSARHLIRQDERDEAQHEAQLWGTGQRKRGLLPGVKATLRRRAVGKASTAARAGAAPAVASKVACGGACGGPTHASHPPGSLDSRPPRPAASGGSPASARVASGDVAVARGGVRLRRGSVSFPMNRSGSLSGCESSSETDRSARSQGGPAASRRRRPQGSDGCGEAPADAAAGAQRAPPHRDSLHWVEKVMMAVGSPCAAGLGWFPAEPDPLGVTSSQQSDDRPLPPPRTRHASFSPDARRSGAAMGSGR